MPDSTFCLTNQYRQYARPSAHGGKNSRTSVVQVDFCIEATKYILMRTYLKFGKACTVCDTSEHCAESIERPIDGQGGISLVISFAKRK